MKIRDVMQAKILDAAVIIASKEGLAALTRDAVALRAGVPNGSINFYFSTMAHLRAKVMRKAVADEILSILAEGIVAKHPVACGANRSLRIRALQSLAGK